MKDDKQRKAILLYVSSLYIYSSYGVEHWKKLPGGVAEYKMDIPVGILLPIAQHIGKDAENLMASFFLAGLRQYVDFAMKDLNVTVEDIAEFLAENADKI